jgi:hypothetical protein
LNSLAASVTRQKDLKASVRTNAVIPIMRYVVYHPSFSFSQFWPRNPRFRGAPTVFSSIWIQNLLARKPDSCSKMRVLMKQQHPRCVLSTYGRRRWTNMTLEWKYDWTLNWKSVHYE